MKNNNYYNLSIFERVCLIISKVFNVLLFIFSFQYVFQSEHIVVSIICVFICIVCIGCYLANSKINEKIGRLMEENETYKNNN